MPILGGLERMNSLRRQALEGVFGQASTGTVPLGNLKTACFLEKSTQRAPRIGISRAFRLCQNPEIALKAGVNRRFWQSLFRDRCDRHFLMAKNSSGFVRVLGVIPRRPKASSR